MANLDKILEQRYQEKIEQLKGMDIIAVAESLGMDLKQESGGIYHWLEHDSFKLYPKTNSFRWWSRELSGDTIDLVRIYKEETTGEKISFQDATRYLETGDFKSVEARPIPKEEPFRNYLESSETKDLTQARNYLVKERGLSESTVLEFEKAGLLGQATYKKNNHTEQVIIFRSLDSNKNMIGGTLQGIEKYPEIHDRGYLKQIMAHSDGQSGMSFDIGKPKRLVFTEAPIDLMSYYELNKDKLSDVRLVSMDGLKQATVSRYVADLLSQGKASEEMSKEDLKNFLPNLAKVTTHFDNEENRNLITLAVDNDEAGNKFIERFKEINVPVIPDVPPLSPGQEKNDWNDFLKNQNKDIGLYIRFEWSENKAIRDRFEADELIPYEEFIEILYSENERLKPEENGYDKTAFDIENEKGERYTFGIRYGVGSEPYPLSELMDERFSEEYIEYASNLDKKVLEKIQSELDKTKKNQKEIKDSDGDGLTDDFEEAIGTNPNSPDSDGDGLTDGVEVSSGSDPLKSQNLEISELIKSNDTKALSEILENGIKEYYDSDHYKAFLDSMASFHKYSARNIMLIQKQYPTASLVASFNDWKKRNGMVKKGSKAIYVLAPCEYIKKDPNGNPIIDPLTNKPEKGVFFKRVPVFDISQVVPQPGKQLDVVEPIKKIHKQLTKEEAIQIFKVLKEVSLENNVPITFEEITDGSNGFYRPLDNTIHIAKGRSAEQTLSTIIHEMAHSDLHNVDALLSNMELLSVSTKELQAESVAYVVSKHLGLDTSNKSFGYLASWSEDKETLKDLKAQLNIVQKEASSLIKRIDEKMQKYQMIEKEVIEKTPDKKPKNAFYERLDKARTNEKISTNSFFDQHKIEKSSKKESRTM